MLPVVPRSVNSVACVKRIQHEIHVSWQAQYFTCIGFYLSNFSFVHLLLQVFQQETLSSSNTDFIFWGSIDIMSEGTRTSIMRQPWIN